MITKKRGRKPLEIDPKKVEALASQGLNELQIAQVLGINWKTLQDRKLKLKSFQEALDLGKAKGCAKVANALFTNACGGQFQAQKFYLCNRDPENWKDKVESEQNLSGQIVVVMDDQDLKA